MKLKIPAFLESFLLRGASEYEERENDGNIDEERVMINRLLFCLQLRVCGLSEYEDFKDGEETLKKAIRGNSKHFIPIALYSALLIYGNFNFILVATKVDELKPMVIYAVFCMVRMVYTNIMLFLFIQPIPKMINLVNLYLMSCSPLCSKKRKLYKNLTLAMNCFIIYAKTNIFMIFVLNYWNNAFCFDSDTRFVCGMFCPFWFPVETNYFPVREIIVAIGAFVAVNYSCMAGIYIPIWIHAFVELFLCEAENLMKLIKNSSLGSDEDIENIRVRLRFIKDSHQKLYEYWDLVEKILSRQSFPLVIGATPTIAAILYIFLKDPKFSFLIEGTGMVFVVAVWIESLEMTSDMFEKFEMAIYNMDWYRMDCRIKKEFMLLHMKSQKAVKIKSFLFVVGRPFLLSLLKTIYSFMTFITQSK